MTNIVVENVSQTAAPAPSKLQGTGYIVSQGGTNTEPGTVSLLTQLSDLTPIVEDMTPISSITYLAGLATVTVPVGTLPASDAETIEVIIAGAAPAGYNGTAAATVTSPTTFTYPIASSPGPMTAPGSVMLEAVPELTAQADTFFAQGNTCGCYVIEFGPGDTADGVAALDAWIKANPGVVYSFLVPREWDNEPAFLALAAQYQALESKVYFFVTTTLATYARYTNLQKCIFAMIEAPNIPDTEFSVAAAWYVTLNYNPSTTNRVTPLSFSFLFGVTPYPTKGNAALLKTLKIAAINIVGTGAEGGISTAVLLYGTTMDARPFNYWYAADWGQINTDLDVANEVIIGSNNPLAPLYYDQPGVNRLQARAQRTMDRGISYGLFLGPVTVSAVGFYAYVKNAPSDFRIGKYSGLGVSCTPNRGFDQIFFNINVQDFVLQ